MHSDGGDLGESDLTLHHLGVPKASLGRPAQAGLRRRPHRPGRLQPRQCRGFAPTPQEFQFGVRGCELRSPLHVGPGLVPKAVDVIPRPGVPQSTELDYTLGLCGSTASRSRSSRATTSGDHAAGPAGALLPRDQPDVRKRSARRDLVEIVQVLEPVPVARQEVHMDGNVVELPGSRLSVSTPIPVTSRARRATSRPRRRSRGSGSSGRRRRP